MINTEFEDEIRHRLGRAAAHASELTGPPTPALITQSPSPSPSPSPRRPVARAAWLAGIAAAITIAVVGAVALLNNDPSELVTTNSPEPSATDGQTPADTTPPDHVDSDSSSLSALLKPDTVQLISAGPIEGRIGPAYVWTGTEMLVWGGAQPRPAGGEDPLSDGAAYDPRTNTWRLLRDAPIRGRSYPAVAWTGHEMVVWGGSSNGEVLDDGAAYNPTTDMWRTISESPLGGAMKSGVVWTGEELLIVGGLNGDSSGAAYNPSSDSWRRLPDAPGLITPPYPQAVWTGERAYFVLVSGDLLGDLIFASYEPATDKWETIPHKFPTGALPFLVWTGEEVIGVTPAAGLAQQAFDPTTGEWRQLPRAPEGGARSAPSTPLPFTGREILMWSGGDTGLALDTQNGSWRSFPAGGLGFRVDSAVVWADGVLLTWGGFVQQADGTLIGANDGIMYAAQPEGNQAETATWLAILGQELPVSAVPEGWMVLEVGPYRFAVPQTWEVPVSRSCLRGTNRVVLVSRGAEQATCSPEEPLPKSVLSIEAGPAGLSGPEPNETVGTFPATRVDVADCGNCPLTYLLPYGYQISVTGPEAERVLSTFTDSGSTRVLQSGPTAETAGWREVEYDGIGFAVPSEWVTVDLPASFRESTTPDGEASVSGKLNPGACGRPMFPTDQEPQVSLGRSPLAPRCLIQFVKDLSPGIGMWIRPLEPDDAASGGPVLLEQNTAGLQISVVDIDRLASRSPGTALELIVSDGVSTSWITLGVGVDTATARSIVASLHAVG